MSNIYFILTTVGVLPLKFQKHNLSEAQSAEESLLKRSFGLCPQNDEIKFYLIFWLFRHPL